ncbi:MAG: 50S ribosomal protein L3 [Myxococcales bacterium]|nr:50S ribosomal protein L3 [Myxococcales bacterium]
MKGLLARKIGMTQVYTTDGRRIPVTVLDASSNVVVQKKSAQGKDGYTAIKIGFGEAHKMEKEGTEPRWRLTKPMVGVFQKAGIEVPRTKLTELRVSETELDSYEVGQELPATLFKSGQYVDVTGTSKGRGFTGVMKRHNFKGMKASHGTHEYFRHGGSIGASADPARVFKGTKMAGQHGNARTTVQNIHVVEVIEEDNLILVKGGVPGPNGAIVLVRTAVKKPRIVKPIEAPEEG